MLSRAGFLARHGKGSHVNWYHPKYPGRVTLSGKDGDDAHRYQENLIEAAIKHVEKQP